MPIPDQKLLLSLMVGRSVLFMTMETRPEFAQEVLLKLAEKEIKKGGRRVSCQINNPTTK